MQRIETDAIQDMRNQLARIGCVFDFALFQLTSGETADKPGHRRALAGLFKQIDEEQSRYWDELLIRRPEYQAQRPTVTRHELAKAEPVAMNAAQIHLMVDTLDQEQSPRGNYAPLFNAFCDPPYGLRIGAEEALLLYQQWCELLGLLPTDGIDMLDWVGWPQRLGNTDANTLYLDQPRAGWSAYFDAGLEWWGVYCLTSWNPQRNILAAIAASTTD